MPTGNRRYFTLADIDMLRRVLDRAEQRRPAPDPGCRTLAPRALIDAFQTGTRLEVDFDTLLVSMAPENTSVATARKSLKVAIEGVPRSAPFGRRMQVDGGWTVFRIADGKPAVYGSWKMVDLGIHTAERALKILNQPAAGAPYATSLQATPLAPIPS